MRASRKDPLLGVVLSERYRLDTLIGRGGFGAVYEAEQLGVKGRRVAVKVLEIPRVLSSEQQDVLVARFHREAEAMAVLNHPHIVQMFGFGDDEETGLLWLAMEKLQGEDLSEFIKREAPIAPVRAVKIVEQVCRGLTEAHKAGIIHRDLKPGNIYMCSYGSYDDWVKVLDFGIARLADAESEQKNLTKTGMVTGTPRYMSPEQCKADGVITPVSDLYSLGCILFELLTGEAPFNAGGPAELLLKQLQATIPRVVSDELLPHESRVWSQAMLRLLAKKPRARPGSSTDMIALLQDTLAQCRQGPGDEDSLLTTGTRESEGSDSGRGVGTGVAVPTDASPGGANEVREKSSNERPDRSSSRDGSDSDSTHAEAMLQLPSEAVDQLGSTISSRSLIGDESSDGSGVKSDFEVDGGVDTSSEDTGRFVDSPFAPGERPAAPRPQTARRALQVWALALVTGALLFGLTLFGQRGDDEPAGQNALEPPHDDAPAARASLDAFYDSVGLPRPPVDCTIKASKALSELAKLVHDLAPSSAHLKGLKRFQAGLSAVRNDEVFRTLGDQPELVLIRGYAAYRAERRDKAVITSSKLANTACVQWSAPLLLMGRAKMAVMENAAAIDLLVRALSPEYSDLQGEARADTFVRLAILNRGKWDEVIRYAERAIDLGPTAVRSKALSHRGHAYLEKSRNSTGDERERLKYDELALRDLHQAAATSNKSDEAKARLSLAIVLKERGRQDEAGKQCERSVKLARELKMDDLVAQAFCVGEEKVANEAPPLIDPPHETDGGVVDMTGPWAEASATYMKHVKAYNDYDRDAYFAGYSEEMNCWYSSDRSWAEKHDTSLYDEVVKSRRRHFDQKLPGHLIVQTLKPAFPPGQAQVGFIEHGTHTLAGEDRAVTRGIIMELNDRDGAWRIFAEVDSGSSVCAQDLVSKLRALVPEGESDKSRKGDLQEARETPETKIPPSGKALGPGAEVVSPAGVKRAAAPSGPLCWKPASPACSTVPLADPSYSGGRCKLQASNSCAPCVTDLDCMPNSTGDP